MKFATLLFSLIFAFKATSQGSTCAQMTPLCADAGLTFSVDDTGTDATIDEPGNDYDCLFSAPSPNWFYIEVDLAGNIDMQLSAADDIDFIIWGPFASLAQAQASCGNMTNVVDCSFDFTNIESPSIPNAQIGEVYVMMVTNYAGIAQDIDLIQTGGTGGTDCSIVTPDPCFMSYLGISSSACLSGSVYEINGQVVFSDNPGGNLIIEVSNGVTTYTQTIPGPFIDGDTLNTFIGNLDADGLAYTYTCYFENSPTCSMSINSVAPDACNCSADIGTFTVNQTGQSANAEVLCFGDNYTISSNNDYVTPPDMNDASIIYDPGISYLVYSCPPTIAVNPALFEDLNTDPCLVAVITGAVLNEVNDLYWMNAYPGVFTNNTVYFVPITMYSNTDLIYSIVYPGVYNCYEMGTPFAVQYLPEVNFTEVSDCQTGIADVTLSGGLPEVNGAQQFSAVAGTLTPPNASFVNTTCSNNGTISVSGLLPGQTYSFDVNDGNGCLITVSGTVFSNGTVDLTYSSANYCANEPDPSPTLVGNIGGAFASTPGLVINPTSGVIDLSASTPGTYVVVYSGVGGACPPSDVFQLTINALPVILAGADQTVCQGNQVTLNANGAPTIVWNNGVVNNTPFTPAVTTTYTATGTSSAGCISTDDVLVTVLPLTPPTFTVSDVSGCSPLTVTFTNTSGGTNCEWQFSDGTTDVGCGSVTHTFTNVGCYDVTLTTTTASGCTSTTTQNNMVCVVPDPNASFVPNPSVLSTLDASSQMINNSTNAITYEWNFGDGGTSSLTNPLHVFPNLEPGNYTVELIAISADGCRDTTTRIIIVEEELIYYVPNSFTPDGDEFNQTFQPVFTSGFDPFDFNMIIFDRWGEVIFETNNAEFGWDGSYHGKIVKEGTYSWKIEFKTTKSDARKVAVGHVNVLR
jgi:gliding motility-associated-like protein